MGAFIEIGNKFYEIQYNFASFSCSDLDDEGLSTVSDYIEIENLNLQETEITNNGIKYLKKLKYLNILRLKGNPQLTNECIPYLTDLENLQELQIHETSIDQDGLEKLVVLEHLENIVLEVWENNFTYEGLLKFSIAMPNCTILAKGDGEFHNGKFNGKWGH